MISFHLVLYDHRNRRKLPLFFRSLQFIKPENKNDWNKMQIMKLVSFLSRTSLSCWSFMLIAVYWYQGLMNGTHSHHEDLSALINFDYLLCTKPHPKNKPWEHLQIRPIFKYIRICLRKWEQEKEEKRSNIFWNHP